MKAYIFDITCRYCGGDVAHITGGTSSGFETRAIAKCVDCRTSWTVVVYLADPSGGRSISSAGRLESMARAREAKKPRSDDKRWHKA